MNNHKTRVNCWMRTHLEKPHSLNLNTRLRKKKKITTAIVSPIVIRTAAFLNNDHTFLYLTSCSSQFPMYFTLFILLLTLSTKQWHLCISSSLNELHKSISRLKDMSCLIDKIEKNRIWVSNGHSSPFFLLLFQSLFLIRKTNKKIFLKFRFLYLLYTNIRKCKR